MEHRHVNKNQGFVRVNLIIFEHDLRWGCHSRVAEGSVLCCTAINWIFCLYYISIQLNISDIMQRRIWKCRFKV